MTATLQDMTRLPYLHEPGVLWNLKDRYRYDDIYTYTGSILIAVNPFQPLPHMYGTHMMDQYRGAELGELSPHVYAIADAAYRQMRKEMRGQSILVGYHACTHDGLMTAACLPVAFRGGCLQPGLSNGRCNGVDMWVVHCPKEGNAMVLSMVAGLAAGQRAAWLFATVFMHVHVCRSVVSLVLVRQRPANSS